MLNSVDLLVVYEIVAIILFVVELMLSPLMTLLPFAIKG